MESTGSYKDTESDHRALYAEISLCDVKTTRGIYVPIVKAGDAKTSTMKNNVAEATYTPN